MVIEPEVPYRFLAAYVAGLAYYAFDDLGPASHAGLKG